MTSVAGEEAEKSAAEVPQQSFKERLARSAASHNSRARQCRRRRRRLELQGLGGRGRGGIGKIDPGSSTRSASKSTSSAPDNFAEAGPHGPGRIAAALPLVEGGLGSLAPSTPTARDRGEVSGSSSRQDALPPPAAGVALGFAFALGFFLRLFGPSSSDERPPPPTVGAPCRCREACW